MRRLLLLAVLVGATYALVRSGYLNAVSVGFSKFAHNLEKAASGCRFSEPRDPAVTSFSKPIPPAG